MQYLTGEQLAAALGKLYDACGYQQFRMSRFEEYDLYLRNKDFLLSDSMITFTDRSGKLLAMKPDVTLSIIQNTTDAPGLVQKLHYKENVYRLDKDSHGFKEILQTGLECVGDLGSFEIAEVLLLAAKSLAAISQDFVLDISHMGLVSQVLQESGLEGADREAALGFLHAKNAHQLRQLLDAKVDSQTAQKLLIMADGLADSATVLSRLEPLLQDGQLQAMAELKALLEILSDAGYGKNVQVDFSVAGALKYYNGVVFRGFVPGVPERVLSGGQYDKLLQKLGRKSAAIGFAVYVNLLERLSAKQAQYDVDTLLLHDGSVPTRLLMAAAENLRKQGSVLVATREPEGRTWRQKLYYDEMGGGKA